MAATAVPPTTKERTMNFVGVVKRANNPASSAAADALGQAAATRPSTRSQSALLALPGGPVELVLPSAAR